MTTTCAVAQMLVPISFRMSVYQGWERLWRPMDQWLQKLLGLADRWTPRWLSVGTEVLGRGVETCSAFFTSWLTSRSYRKLFWGLPAVMFAMPLLVTTVMLSAYSRADRLLHYEAAALQAAEEDDQERRWLCVRRLEQLGLQRSEQVGYRTGLRLARAGRWDDAHRCMLEVAPLERPGYARAHAWIAQAVAEHLVSADDRWSLVRTHAQHALATDSENAIALRYLAAADLAIGKRQKGIQRLKRVAPYFAEVQADLMSLYFDERDLPEAREAAKRVIQTLEGLVARNSIGALTAAGYRRWVQAYELLQDRQGMKTTLELGIKAFPEDRHLKSMLSRLLAQDVWQHSTEDAAHLPSLRRALQLDRDNEACFLLLARGLIREHGEVVRMVEVLSHEQLIDVNLFLVVGDFFAGQQRFRKALHYYQQATALAPGDARAWNNVAWILFRLSPNRWEEALAAANKAVEAEPLPGYYETRGQIFCSLQRWQEASVDLERALNGHLLEPRAARESLIRAYEALGAVEQAEAHRRLAVHP